MTVEGWELDSGRRGVAKVVDEGRRWLARGAGRGGVAGELANWDRGQSKSGGADEEPPYGG